MLYFGSLLIIFIMLSSITIVGRRICDILPYRLKPYGYLYFSPVLGLSFFVLIATINGWLMPFKQWMCLTIAIPIVCISIFFESNKNILLRYLLILFLFSIIVSSTVLIPILRFNAYNPFNDTFTYLVHSQWLQEHAFSEQIISSGFYSALTQISCYQSAGCRMAASFFLGWTQALFGIEWSYNIYPAVVSIALIAGSLAAGGLVNIVFKNSRLLSFLTAIAIATTLNGYTFGAAYGFFPQTFGLAFACASLALIGGIIPQISKIHKKSRLFISILPISICFSAFCFSYNDLMSLCVVTISGYLILIALLKLVKIRNLLKFLAIFVFQTLIFINYETIRILRNFIHGVVEVAVGKNTIGWPVLWSPYKFVAHAFGIKSSIDDFWIINSQLLSYFILSLSLLIIFYFIFYNYKRQNQIYYLPYIIMILIFAVTFIYFRYFVPNQTPEQIGITFLQYKLTQWASPFCISLLGVSLAFLNIKWRKYKKIIPIYLFILILSSISINWKISELITNHFLKETGYNKSSFSALINLREIVKEIPAENPIYLKLGTIHQKLRQMVTYVLYDRKTFSDFRDDGYIFGKLPIGERNIPISNADWAIEYNQDNNNNLNLSSSKSGNIVLKRIKEIKNELISVSGSYESETEGKDWWYWTKNSIEFKYKIFNDINKIRLKFAYLPAISGEYLKINIDSRNTYKFKIMMEPGWHDYISTPIKIEGNNLKITFSTKGKPIQISENDPRLLSFLIKNLIIETVQ